MKITIFGIGALGTLFASRLRQVANTTISLIGHWPEQIRTINTDGLKIHEQDGTISEHRLQIYDDVGKVKPADVVIVLVKSYQTSGVAAKIPDLLNESGFVLTLQNGLGNLETLAKSISPKRIVQGITLQGATAIEPGLIRHTANSPTYIGQSKSYLSKIKHLVSIVNRAGLETELSQNTESMIWGKLLINAAINPLTALLKVPNGALAENELYLEMITKTVSEVASVTSKLGIELPFDNPIERAIDACRTSATNHSSMLQDILNKRPTEIEAICGQIVKIGKQKNIATPVNIFLLEHVKALEHGYNFDPARFAQIM